MHKNNIEFKEEVDMGNNIKKVVDQGLCTGCGTCKSICSYDAIYMGKNISGFVIPIIDEEKCINCDMCLQSCPGKGLPKRIIEGFNDIFWGKNLSAYIGKACDEELWKNGQSGGVVSALLLYLIDNKIINSAIVNDFDQVKKRSTVKKAYNKQDLLKSQGSYYSQTPVNEVAISKSTEKTAAVVLGCQSEGIELAKKIAKNKYFPKYLIGLICAGNYSGLIFDDLIKQSKIDYKSVESFRFRDKRYDFWPGNVVIKTKNTKKILHKRKRTKLKEVYGNYRCQLCFDQMNIFSDVIVGDPWKIEIKNKEEGYSIFLARTKKGKELITNAINKGYIKCKVLPVEKIYIGQTVDDRLKKQFFTNKKICEEKKWPFPEYEIDFSTYSYKKGDKKIFKDNRKKLKHQKNFQKLKSKREIEKRVKKEKHKIKNIVKEIKFYIILIVRPFYRKIFKKENKK